MLVTIFLIVCGLEVGEYVVATSESASSSQEYPIPYENSTFGVYTYYPNTWDVLTSSYNKGDRILQIAEFWSPDGTADVTINRDIFDMAETLDTYLAETVQSYSSKFTNFTLLNSDTSNTMLAGNPGYSLSYTYNEDDTGLAFMTFEVGTIIPGTDMVYYAEYNAPLIYYASNQDSAQTIIESLEFHIELPETEIGQPPESYIEESGGEAAEI